MAKTRVLIIDDDRELAGELQGALLFKGYDADCCTDERQARLRARLFKPDVILLDLRMPVKSGFKVAQELRDGGDAAGIPIIGMTGVANGGEAQRLMGRLGFADCLLKPFFPLDIITKIELALARRTAPG